VRRKAHRGWAGIGRFLRNLVVTLLVIALIGPVIGVAIYRFVPPPITFLMVERLFQGHGLDHRWRPLSQIAPDVPHAAIAAEDAHFCEHHGFDVAALRKAMAHDEADPERLRGGSTISQQTAKNVFLWPDRSWTRKAAETYFTVLIETIWGKRRIMEVYLNTVEMGPGIYGVEAASEHYFGESARDLTPDQAARLVAILPSPLKWRAVRPGPYVRRRIGRIDAGARTVDHRDLAACLV